MQDRILNKIGKPGVTIASSRDCPRRNNSSRPYKPTMDKIMRLHSVSSAIENGFVHLPENAEWLAVYLHELVTFPKGKHDDQADSTSQALDWAKQRFFGHTAAIFNGLTGQRLA